MTPNHIPTDDATAKIIINSHAQPKYTNAKDMWFVVTQLQCQPETIPFFLRYGTTNLADYQSNTTQLVITTTNGQCSPHPSKDFRTLQAPSPMTNKYLHLQVPSQMTITNLHLI